MLGLLVSHTKQSLTRAMWNPTTLTEIAKSLSLIDEYRMFTCKTVKPCTHHLIHCGACQCKSLTGPNSYVKARISTVM